MVNRTWDFRTTKPVFGKGNKMAQTGICILRLYQLHNASYPSPYALYFKYSHKNIFDVKICPQYIFSYDILCKKRFETSKFRRVNSFIKFVNTVATTEIEKNVTSIKNKTKIYGKVLGTSAILWIMLCDAMMICDEKFWNPCMYELIKSSIISPFCSLNKWFLINLQWNKHCIAEFS